MILVCWYLKAKNGGKLPGFFSSASAGIQREAKLSKSAEVYDSEEEEELLIRDLNLDSEVDAHFVKGPAVPSRDYPV